MLFKQHKDFRIKTLREIQWWAWAASVIPLAALAAVFFIWAYGTNSMFNLAMIIGSSTMVVIAVVWWWWALHAIKTLIDHWDETKNNVKTVVVEVRDLKTFVREVFRPSKDK
jgi:hypothetical protein